MTDIGGFQINFTYYLREVVERVVSHLPIIDITNKLNHTDISALVKPGKYISAQLAFYFKEEEPYKDYEFQRKKAYYRGNKIRLEFSFNAWECTSSSARFDHMTSRRVITPVLFVTSVIKEKGWIIISTSCLAVGSHFDDNRVGSNYVNI